MMKTWTDRRLQGITLATCACAMLASHVSAVPVNLTQESSAFTFTRQLDIYNAGDTATSMVAPLESFGNVFTHWTLDGVRQTDVTGASRNPIVFQILGDETAIAQYLWSPSWSPTDTDNDGILDWFELRMNGDLAMAPTDDGDNDGLDFSAEFYRGTHPAISNRIDQGGITARDSVAANFIFNTNYVEIVEISDPLGLIPERRAVAEVGSTFVSNSRQGYAPGSDQKIFTYWQMNGQPALGPAALTKFGLQPFPIPSAVFTVTGPTVLTALYISEEENADGDLLPNWFELATGPHDYLFPVLFWNEKIDYDGDDLNGLGEFVQGSHPMLSNRVDQGGICMRDSPMFPVNPGQWPELAISSQPFHILSPQRIFAPTGTTVVTPLAPIVAGEEAFAFWALNGARAAHPSGVPYNPLSVVLWSNQTSVAQYGNPDVDLDVDGLPDVFETGHFGSLAFGPSSNLDGDAFTVGDEFLHGFSPHLTNTIAQGGVTARDSVSVGVDLRFFPLVQDVLVDDHLEAFFGDGPGSAGTFQALNGWSHPALGDWDGDGDLDLFVASKAGKMRIFENAGSPVYMNLIDRTTNFANLAFAWTNQAVPHPVLGDWDADGRADLAVGGVDGEITFVKSTGRFVGTQNTMFTTNMVFGNATNVVPGFATLRTDGFLDLLVMKDNGEVELFLRQEGDAFPYLQSQSAPNIIETPLDPAWSMSMPGPRPFGVASDLFVSDTTGRIWQYSGGPYSFAAVSKVYAGTFDGFATRLTISMGDVDGDGDDDVICGMVGGGLLFLRNNEPKLAIRPPVTTLVSGDDLDFSVLNSSDYIDWSFYRRNSRGFIESELGSYTAGPVSRVTDTIMGRELYGDRYGLAYVNVISPSDITLAGKAIIVAGGKSFDDPVWLATDHVADHAYGTLRFRGFSKQNTHYLSFDPNQDVDGNGLLDDIDGASSFANVEHAFTNFVSNADKLFVYMANHGSDAAGNGFFRLNASETLAATNVNQWLNTLQDANTNLDVTVVLDFCYAGSFIDELAYTGTAKRVVITATGSDELTYFIAGGLVSFSDVFFSALLQGLDLQTAYALAADAMSAYQNAELDDNKDGVFQEGVDGDIAADIVPGASFLVGRDIPVIGEVSPSQIITGATAMVWADAVSSAYPIQRVWCSVIPPSHQPNTNAGVPVIDVAEADLFYNRSTRRYEASLEGFTEQGSYQININAEDVWGSVSFPRQTVVTQSGFDERLVIAVGSPVLHPRYAGMKSVAMTAYQTALSRQLTHDKIHLMMPELNIDVDGDGTNDVDSGVTQVDVDFAMLSFATSADRLTLCLIGETTNGDFVIQGGALSASTLDGHLDAYQATDKAVNLLLEFDDAGAWPPQLLAPTGKERIVIASTRAGRSSLMSSGGFVSFTHFFLSEIFQGKTIGAATSIARRTIRRASGRLRQRPGIDDDGDGIVNEKNVDGLLASGRYMGAAFLTGDDIPFIGNPMPPTVTLSNTATLWAADVLDVDGISNVWVVVTPPDFDDSESPPSVPLTYNAGNDRFEATSGMFSNSGLYVLTFYATDTLGQLSAAVQSTITRTDNPYAVPDAFEPDDVSADASVYQQAQLHTFHVSNDCDWVRAYLLTNFAYDIETIHHGDTIDTVLDVYRENLDGSLTLVDSVDDFGFDDGELTGLDFPASGWYLIKVTSYHELGFEPGAYTLIIDIPAGNGAFLVMAVDALTGGPLTGGASVRVNGGAPVSFAGQTALALNLAGGDHSLEVLTGAGYVPVQSTLDAGQVNNASNAVYGNPRAVAVADVAVGSAGFSAFAYLPVIQVMGHVEDATTSVDVVGATLSFDATSGDTAGTTYDRYPHAAVYAPPWQTVVGGAFPGSLLLLAGHDYQASLWSPLHFTSSVPVNISGLAPGATLDLGTIALIPDPALGPIDLYPFPGPDWWYARSVVISNPVSGNDFAAVNQGQLKALATAAAAAITAEHGGTTPAISNMVSGFTQNSNFSAVNAGQAKHVASVFYDWLIIEHVLTAYPWAGAPQTNDHALINAGQLKFLFSFPISQP